MLLVIITCFIFIRTTWSSPTSNSNPELNNLTSPYTLTIYQPGDCTWNGQKVENVGLMLQPHAVNATSYCELTGSNAVLCPNGMCIHDQSQQALTDTQTATETVFTNLYLQPLSEVPGAQDLFVTINGHISITQAHNHEFAPGVFHDVGWAWTPLPVDQSPLKDCPPPPSHGAAEYYNCDPPTGYFTFKAPNATKGGIEICDDDAMLYAITPESRSDGCFEVVGLGTHPFSGEVVWAYN